MTGPELERCDDEIVVAAGDKVIRCALGAGGHRTHRQQLTVGSNSVDVRWIRRGDPVEEGPG